MKRTIYALLLLLFIISGTTAHAQREDLDRKWTFGFGLEAAKPVGDKVMKEYYGGGGGITGRVSYHAGPGYVTLTTGALFFIPKDFDEENVEVGVQVPVKLGYKYVFAQHLFVQAEAGYSSFAIGYEDEYGDPVTKSYGGFTYAPTIGANFGVFEVGLRYESIMGIKSGDEKYSLNSAALRIGFNF